jgi:predicted SnoaL-like aldol condensation-catalyzing enzyme
VTSVSDLNKRKVRLFVEAVLNEGRLELIDELVTTDFVGRDSSTQTGAVVGPAAVRRLVSERRREHPDLYIKIEDQIAEDDRVAVRWRATTRANERPDEGSPTRCMHRYTGISIIRLLAGKQVDSHTEYTDFIAVSV